MKRSNRFLLQELVCRHVFNRDIDQAWRYFRPVTIDFLDWFREEINRPVYINNWNWGGDKTQRGLRCNLCALVASKKTLYMTAHLNGTGIDFNVKDMTPNQTRSWLETNIHKFFTKFPQYIAKCRLEYAKDAPTWVHIDFYEHVGPNIVQYVNG
jgi:hypothetical protein